MHSLSRHEVPVAIEGDGVDFRHAPIGGDQSVAFVRLPAGTNLAPALKGLPGDLCPCPHWGYMISGRLRMHTASGEETYEAGDAFYWAARHAPEALEDCEYVDFSPTHELERVVAHIQSGAAASA